MLLRRIQKTEMSYAIWRLNINCSQSIISYSGDTFTPHLIKTLHDTASKYSHDNKFHIHNTLLVGVMLQLTVCISVQCTVRRVYTTRGPVLTTVAVLLGLLPANVVWGLRVRTTPCDLVPGWPFLGNFICPWEINSPLTVFPSIDPVKCFCTEENLVFTYLTVQN